MSLSTAGFASVPVFKNVLIASRSSTLGPSVRGSAKSRKSSRFTSVINCLSIGSPKLNPRSSTYPYSGPSSSEIGRLKCRLALRSPISLIASSSALLSFPALIPARSASNGIANKGKADARAKSPAPVLPALPTSVGDSQAALNDLGAS